MTLSNSKRADHIKHTRPTHPEVKAIGVWFSANRGLYADFRQWLRRAHFSASAVQLYSVAARMALGLLDKPYWQIDLDGDLDRVRQFIDTHYRSASTRESYFKGLNKFEHYLRLRCHTPRATKTINWTYYVDVLPDWLADDVRVYYAHARRTWPLERQYEISIDWLSQLTRPLRGMATLATLHTLADFTPELWNAYLGMRLAFVKPITLNGELRSLQQLLSFLAEHDARAMPDVAGHAICARMLRVEPLAEETHLPRDVPIAQLQRLLQVIEVAASSTHQGVRRMGLMDRAWFLLMLHSGLRSGEVRRLRLGDIDWPNRVVRIEQSKGLKDRQICLSTATIDALRAYLAVRGPAEALPDHVFIYRHAPLTQSYCGQRLSKYYAKRCGVRVTPHQLRHSCATLLLNAGAPILTVQTILGHQHVDTTLGYARLYDGTVAADYCRAMMQIESQLALNADTDPVPPDAGQLIALLDALRSGTLNEMQIETLHVLRAGLVAWAEREAMHVDATV